MSSTETSPRAAITPVGDNQVVITRTFTAPRALVWEAMTRPEHVRNWYGAHMGELVTCEIDLRVDGRWHYVQRDPDGVEHSFSGTYLEIDAPQRLVSTEGYDNVPGAEYVATLTLEEADGVTTLTNTLTYPGPEVREGHLGSGMEVGLNASYDALERIAQSLAA